MDGQPLLSFAIPTYNFGSFISQTVCSIFDGLETLSPNQIEVVIVDGASVDGTPEVVERLAAIYPNIRYVRMEKRGGIDYDLNYAARQSNGRFIWFMSADDVLMHGWDTCLVPILKDPVDIVLVPAVLCDKAMAPIRLNRIFDVEADKGPIFFELNRQIDLNKYLQKALTLEALFSFMSSIVVRNSTWQDLVERPDYFKSCWAHCARLIPLLLRTNKNGAIVYANNFVLQKRIGNDSFMEHGLTRRIAITVDGWTRIISEFFPDSYEQEQLYRVLRNDASVLLFMYAKLVAQSSGERAELDRMIHKTHYSECKTILSRFQYFSFLMVPPLPMLASVLSSLGPVIARMRHRIKGYFN